MKNEPGDIAAGDLIEVITLEAKSVTKNTMGEEVITWSTFAENVNAAAEPLSGREFVSLRQTLANVSIRFRFRYLSGVNSTMRVLWRGQYYNILEAINPGARNAIVELLCSGESGNA